jgi:hypothetical protein
VLRAAQLTIATRSPATFQLRVATLRLNSTSTTALENIHRTCSALFVFDDPRVEVLMVDNRKSCRSITWHRRQGPGASPIE